MLFQGRFIFEDFFQPTPNRWVYVVGSKIRVVAFTLIFPVASGRTAVIEQYPPFVVARNSFHTVTTIAASTAFPEQIVIFCISLGILLVVFCSGLGCFPQFTRYNWINLDGNQVTIRITLALASVHFAVVPHACISLILDNPVDGRNRPITNAPLLVGLFLTIVGGQNPQLGQFHGNTVGR